MYRRFPVLTPYEDDPNITGPFLGRIEQGRWSRGSWLVRPPDNALFLSLPSLSNTGRREGS
ncbi:hypothetical protein CH63R_05916 [Colletotrichum higginsianum IMI 349063]|uniref:Uncharacterized protein n=1 Tax=Colletotrichum higginsianum (strain IMI 349063) TaxID=759273 RepID=A0A1B7YEB6_COLHI|nr:hypothetical protein CH63R_05916 [Colletotrichum higginsianum IMI 349063]OBR10224.1 hypothetical protein CH63R_05916 [Colletotrichum higginsianum IMI 349063]GJD02764.1 hypothetical protein ColKHC_11589 [Colletotrichum higginsianum]